MRRWFVAGPAFVTGPALWMLILVGVALIFSARPALAGGTTCTFVGPSLNLGTISPFSGFPASTSGNFGVTCINLDLTPVTVYACLSLASGPMTLSASGSTTPLTIQVTGGSSWPAAIGDGTTFPMEGPIAISVGALSTYTGSLPLVAKLLAPGSSPQPGVYASTFLGTDSQVFYTTATTAPASCAALISGSHSTAPAGFTVVTIVLTQCTVSASSLAFPTQSLLTTAITSNATITTVCNLPLPVTISLDNGATGTGPTARIMRSSLGSITYGIYRDAALTQPWGSLTGTTATNLLGSGVLTAYGQVPVQANPPPGSYSDVVNVTISY